MAELSTADRVRIWRGLMRLWSRDRDEIDLSKSDLQDAVNETDVWINGNQAAYNSALPAAAQSGLTADQKTLLFCAVALARVGILILRRVFGEVD